MRQILGVLLLLSLFSCRKEPTSWDVDLYAPIAHGRLSLDDLVADSIITYNSDGLVILASDFHLAGNFLDTLSSIPDTSVHKSFTTGIPLSLTVPPGNSFITQSSDSKISGGDAQLKFIKVKSGSLNYELKSYIAGELDYSYILPSATIEGVPLSIVGVASPGSSLNPYLAQGTLDLSGSEIDLTGIEGISYNKLTSSLDISTTESYAPGTHLLGFDSLTIDLSFVDVELEYARGYFGQYDLSESSSENLSFMSNLVSGSFEPEAISLRVKMQNSLGVDMQFAIENLRARNSNTGTEIELISPSLYQTNNLTRAFDQNGTVIVNDELDILIDQNNSNIVDFISFLPDELFYSADIQINPLGNISSGNDFLYTSELLDPVISFEVPMCFSAGDLTIRDTLAIENDLDGVDFSGILNVTTVNGFPFGAVVRLSLIDESGEQLIDFADQELFNTADLSSEGYVSNSIETVSSYELGEQELGYISPGNRFVIEFVFDTGNDGTPVKIYQGYYMDVSLTIDAKTTLQLQ